MMVDSLKRALFSLHRSQIYLPRNRRVAAGVARQIGRARSLLDVGCGDGSTACEVARAVGAEEVRGVEVQLRPERQIPIEAFDGRKLPFPDGRFDAVMIADVLHHATHPEELLRECVRVCRDCVVVKDHFAFGPLSEMVLWAMDVAGNASASVAVRGNYFTRPRWEGMVEAAGARQSALEWPFKIHDMPWRALMPSKLQFVARLEPTRAR